MGLKFLFYYYLFLFKNLYRRKNKENSLNALSLSALILILNLISLFLILEVYTSYSFGLVDFWRSNNSPKSIYGYIFGVFATVLYLLLLNFFSKNTAIDKKRLIFRKVIKFSVHRFISYLFLLTSIITFFYMIVIGVVL